MRERFERSYPLLAYLRRVGLEHVDQLERAVERAERFRREHIDPRALEVDRSAMRDPTYVAEDVLRAAARERWFTSIIPKLMGGAGLGTGPMIIALEELAAGCLGLANLISVHGLAVSTVAASGDLARMERLFRRMVAAEREGRAYLLSTAITEPGAGTDMENPELMAKAQLVSEARPTGGGYLLNGRKVFISNGSIADTHVVLMPTDKKRPVETMSTFLVDKGTPGLSVGRVERKMGQKACPAAELCFDDCFVPEDARLDAEPVATRGLDLVLGATRGGVGVMGAGVARGAYERALSYARSHRLEGRWLADHQWVQLTLTDMLKNVMIARAAYLEALFSNELFGLSRALAPNVLDRVVSILPDSVVERLPLSKLLDNDRVRAHFRGTLAGITQTEIDTSSAYGAAAKVIGTDLGMQNCQLAVEIMGADGLRHDRGMEKLFRDAKLLQIYEGTNQLNRIEIHGKLIGADGD